MRVCFSLPLLLAPMLFQGCATLETASPSINPNCTDTAALTLPKVSCRQTEFGRFYHRSENLVELQLKAARTAERNFERLSNSSPPRFTVFGSGIGATAKAAITSANDAGFVLDLKGFESAELESSQHGSISTETFISHELGHIFLNEICPSGEGNEYASTAPDWIDEAVAFAVEVGDDAEARRALFRKQYSSKLKNASTDEFSLEAMLAISHPLSSFSVSRPAKSGGTLQIIAMPTDASFFYEKSQALLDFLADHGGQEQIFELAWKYCQSSGISQMSDDLSEIGDWSSWLEQYTDEQSSD